MPELDPGVHVVVAGRAVGTEGKLNPQGIEVRDSRHPEYGVITLIFVRDGSAPGGLALTSWVALDAQNKRTTIRLANHRYDVAVADNAFAWKDPRRAGSPQR